MAQSVKIDFNVWSHYDHHAYDIIQQDFVHHNLFKANANILTDKGKVRLQKIITHNNHKLDGQHQTNVWFPLISNKSLYLQFRQKGFRIHFDNGLFNRDHLQHNIYASFESNRQLNDHLFKIGCETIAQKWKFNLRYRYSTADLGHTLYSRWRYDYGNWTFQGIKALNLNDFILLKNNCLIGYYFGSKTFHLRLENKGWRTQQINFQKLTIKDIFDSAIFNFTKTLNANSRFGIQTSMNMNYQFRPLSFVWETYDPIYHSTLKLRANSDFSAALSIRNQMGAYGSYVLGIGIKDIGIHNKIDFGIQVDFNV